MYLTYRLFVLSRLFIGINFTYRLIYILYTDHQKALFIRQARHSCCRSAAEGSLTLLRRNLLEDCPNVQSAVLPVWRRFWDFAKKKFTDVCLKLMFYGEKKWLFLAEIWMFQMLNVHFFFNQIIIVRTCYSHWFVFIELFFFFNFDIWVETS